MAAKSVEAIFYDRETKLVQPTTVMLPATAAGSAIATKVTCCDVAWDTGQSHWAHYDAERDRWMIFECTGRSSRVYLGDKPTKEAAEMWLVHLG